MAPRRGKTMALVVATLAAALLVVGIETGSSQVCMPGQEDCIPGGGYGGYDNLPPVANGDDYCVEPGGTLVVNAAEGVLSNDRDPDGDEITARVKAISFANSEWSGLDPDGSFSYTAGPGTRRVLFKTITYVAVDSKGVESEPTTAIVTVERRGGCRRPTPGPRAKGFSCKFFAGSPRGIGPNVTRARFVVRCNVERTLNIRMRIARHRNNLRDVTVGSEDTTEVLEPNVPFRYELDGTCPTSASYFSKITIQRYEDGTFSDPKTATSPLVRIDCT